MEWIAAGFFVTALLLCLKAWRIQREGRKAAELPLPEGVQIVDAGVNYVLLIDSHGAIDPRVRVEYSPLEALHRVLGAHDKLTGDDAFDMSFVIKGDDALISAMFDVEARRFMVPIRSQISIDGGVVRLESTAAHQGADELYALVKKIACTKDEIPERLLKTFSIETEPMAQRRQLQLLFELDLPSELKNRAIDIALSAPDPLLVAWAAMRAGRRGEVILRDMLNDTTLDDELRSQIARNLYQAKRAHLDDVLALLAIANGPKLRTVLAELLSARSLPVADVKRAEVALFALLDVDEPETNLAALAAFGRIGSVAAVETLQTLANSSRASSEIRAAAKRAVRLIQARATTADYGQVSIADVGPAEAGGLSIADLGGGLSLTRGSPNKPGEDDA